MYFFHYELKWRLKAHFITVIATLPTQKFLYLSKEKSTIIKGMEAYMACNIFFRKKHVWSRIGWEKISFVFLPSLNPLNVFTEKETFPILAEFANIFFHEARSRAKISVCFLKLYESKCLKRMKNKLPVDLLPPTHGDDATGRLTWWWWAS